MREDVYIKLGTTHFPEAVPEDPFVEVCGEIVVLPEISRERIAKSVFAAHAAATGKGMARAVSRGVLRRVAPR